MRVFFFPITSFKHINLCSYGIWLVELYTQFHFHIQDEEEFPAENKPEALSSIFIDFENIKCHHLPRDKTYSPPGLIDSLN